MIGRKLGLTRQSPVKMFTKEEEKNESSSLDDSLVLERCPGC